MASNRSKNIFLTTYRDDFRDSDNYHRILFNGGRALQPRELTQLQTIIQKEVERFGRNIFKEGSAVDPVSNVYVGYVDYIKLDTTSNPLPSDTSSLVGTTFSNSGGTTSAVVRQVIEAEGSDPATLFVDYIKTDTASDASTPVRFVAEEEINNISDGGDVTLKVAPPAQSPVGKGTIGYTGDGVFFVQGHFVYTESQQHVVSKYSDTPSSDLGFLVDENIINENDDNSLYDNQGAVPNLSAPGAHRYQIKLSLTTRDEVDSDQNFVYVAKIVDGEVVEVNNGRGDYNKVLDVLAQRTFEESGNYTVTPFIANFEEGDSEGALELIVDPGIAYVNGYRAQPLAQRIEVQKPTDTVTFEEQVTTATYGNWLQTKGDFKGHLPTNNQGIIELKNDSDFGGSTIGTARVRAVCPCGDNTYREYLYDVDMNLGENFRDVVSIGLDSSNYANVNGSPAVLQDPKNNNLFFPLPYDRPSVDTSLQLDMIVHYRFDAVVNVSGEGNITTSDGFSVGGNFTNTTEWIVSVDSSGPLPFTVNVTNPPTSATISVDPSYSGGTMNVHSLIQRQNVLSRTKTLTNNTVDALIESDGAGTQFLNLGKPDVYRVNSAVDSDDNNVIQNYTFDNGQRDNYYDLGRLVLNTNATPPTNRISVDYDYFEHGSTGGYFSVNSYSLDSNFSYSDIPSHRLATGEVVELRNVLDFRPVINDSGDSFDITSGGVINDLPKNTTLLEGDMSFYLPRKDRLVVQQTGEVEYIVGSSSFNPEYPSVPTTAMNLYDIEVNANALGPDDTRLNFIENKRYTMRDIGRLEQKIDDNRELITLSMLELETSTLEVLDENGNNRTKSGFFVDNFRDHRAQDQVSEEFIASVDLENGEMRPAFREKHITVSIDSDNSTNIVRRKNALMLDYDDELFINQPQASGVVNVNPFNVVNNVGFIELTPDKDDWIEETFQQRVIDKAASFINGTTQRTGIDRTGPFQGLWVARSDTIISTLQRIDPNWQQWDWGWWGRTGKTNSRGVIGTTNINRFANEFFDLNGVEYNGTHILNDFGSTVVDRSSLLNELARVGISVSSDRDRTKQQITIPFMRSRLVMFVARNLKPLTRHFAFFDNLDMTDWVNGLSSSSYNIFVNAIRRNPDAYVFSGENRTQHPYAPSPLTSDESGTIYGSFFIPSNSNLRINTGTKRFALYDIDRPDASASSSNAFGEYTATGLEEKTTETISQTVDLVRFDPIAQTVYNDRDHSVFVTKVGVYIGTASSTRDLTCEIRPVVNGYPSGTERLKHATATLPASFLQGRTSDNASVRTDFVFERPIELKAETEYAIVLLSQSNEYNVWVATMNEFKVGSTTEKVTSQPSMGSLFKSQNGATWEPSQNQDLKFQMFVADFSTSGLSGEAAFTVPDVPKKRLPTNPFATTAGSREIRVAHPLHGMLTGDTVELSIWDSAQADSSGVGGLAESFVKGERIIKSYDASGYTFDADSEASISTIGGSYFWESTENAQVDLLYTGYDILRPESTSTSSKIKMTSGKSYAGNETAYVFDTTYTDLASNENNYFDSRKMIANSLLRDENMSGGETVDLRIALSSGNKYVSPVINYMNTSLHCIANIIDNQDSASTSGFNIPIDFRAETNPDGGTSISKYLTKTVTLANESVGLKVIVAANRPSPSSFDVYYKTATLEQTIDDQNWVLATVDNLLPSDDNPDVFREYRYTIGGDTGTLDPFVQFKIKIVMHTTDNTQVPRFRDLRAIALAV